MAKQETTRTAPEAAPQGLDPASFKEHLRPAVREYAAALLKAQPPLRPRRVYRVHEKGLGATVVDFPQYWMLWESEWLSNTLSLTSVRSFVDYIERSGELARSLTGPNPRRESWDVSVLRDVLDGPVCRVLEEAAIEKGIDGSAAEFELLRDAHLETLVEEVTARCCEGKHRYVARCPLGWVAGAAGQTLCLDEGLVLRFYTDRDKAGLLTRNYTQFQWRDVLSPDYPGGVSMLEIRAATSPTILRSGDPPKTGAEIGEEQIASTIDIVKWAFASARGTGTPLIEGTVTYGDYLGGRLGHVGTGAFRRQERSGGIVYKVTSAALERVRELIGDARKYRAQSPDLRQALWCWGRSCLADIDRDVLLNAVFGLEGLLVPNPGESRYRFGLHGASLLSSSPEEAQETAKELRGVYGDRSSAAHGNHAKTVKSAHTARKQLGQAIHALVECFKTGALKPLASKDETVAKQIQAAVLRNAPLRRQATPSS